MTSVRTDAHWRAIGFSHHDGFLDGVVLEDDGRTARLHVRSVAGERHTVKLTDVESLSVDAFRQGNIILTIWCVPASEAVAAGLAERIRARLYLDAAKLPEGRTVFLLDASYGAEIVAICGHVGVGT